jgi:uncharacterized SAM-binding protein YcdF (DUF218 family)
MSAIGAFWAVLRSQNRVTWSIAAAACGLSIGTFTPIGVVLKVPLEYRFAFEFPLSDSQASPDGIIVLGGVGFEGLAVVALLSHHYPKARLIFSGFPGTVEDMSKSRIFAQLGIDPTRIHMESRARTTSEDAVYAAALLKPKPSQRWVLVTSASHMPRAVGCFRVAGFQVEPYSVEFTTSRLHPFTEFAPGSPALSQLDTAAKEWIGLIAYRLMGKTDALFPAP